MPVATKGSEEMQEMQKEADAMLEQLFGAKDAKAASPEIPTTAEEAPVLGLETTDESQENEESEKPHEVEEKPPEKKDEEEGYKHKYDVLRGKYNKEIGELIDDNKRLGEANVSLRKNVEDLTVSIKTLENRLNEREKEEKKTSFDTAMAAVKDRLRESLSEDAAESVETYVNYLMTKNTNTANVGDLERKVQTLETKLDAGDKERQKERRLQFIREVKARIPDLAVKNRNQEWLVWLQDIPPFSEGKTYQELLNNAESACDVEEVVKIFNACPVFKKPAETKKPEPIVEPVGKASKISDTKEKKMYSKKEIDKFFDDCLLGKYKDNWKLKAKLENEYTLAIQQGRIY